MKTQLSITLLSLALAFAACSNNNPKSVAEKFLTAMSKLDFEGAKKYGTDDTGKLLDMMEGFAKMMPDSSRKKESKFTIADEKIDGEKATVTYTEEGRKEVQSIPMMKVNGEWKVAMSKSDMNATEGTHPNTEDEADSSAVQQSAPADAAK